MTSRVRESAPPVKRRNLTESQTNLSKATSAVLKFKYGATLRLRVLNLSIAHFNFFEVKFPVGPDLSDLT